MQDQEKNFRKSPWRFVFLALAVVSGSWLIFYALLMWLGPRLGGLSFPLSPNEAASIGIIGGADGPTAVFVAATTGFDWDVAIMAAAFILGILGFLRLRKCRQK